VGLFGQGVLEAFRLLLAGDAEVWQITWLSLQVSAGATALSLLVGIPLGALLALIMWSVLSPVYDILGKLKF